MNWHWPKTSWRTHISILPCFDDKTMWPRTKHFLWIAERNVGGIYSPHAFLLSQFNCANKMNTCPHTKWRFSIDHGTWKKVQFPQAHPYNSTAYYQCRCNCHSQHSWQEHWGQEYGQRQTSWPRGYGTRRTSTASVVIWHSWRHLSTGALLNYKP